MEASQNTRMDAPRRLVAVTSDEPFPPNCGHRVEQWNRYQALRRADFELFLVTWRSPSDPPHATETDAQLQKVFKTVRVFDIKHNLHSFLLRLIRLMRYPSHVASRIMPQEEQQNLLRDIEHFRPDAVLIDNIYGSHIGSVIAKHFNIPTIVRSHNIEHIYIRQQGKLATSYRDKISWNLACLGLRRHEIQLLRSSRWILDISMDDINFWRSIGITHNSWLPTLFPALADKAVPSIPWPVRRWDICYIGNLRLPNNVTGLDWFLSKCYPILVHSKPNIKICISGSNPCPAMLDLSLRYPDVDYHWNSPTVEEILSDGRVLINPILSGSGINVKSVEMLMYDSPVVTTERGVRGFSTEICNEFLISSEPEGFAHAILQELEQPFILTGSRIAARAIFGEAGVKIMISDIEAAIQN